MNAISENTKAILLLTAPLILGRKNEHAKILTLKEYNSLARALRDLGYQPRDLLGSGADAIVSKLSSVLEPDRLNKLLNRGFLLGQALNEWRRRAIWVVSRADSNYPKRLKTKLRDQAPPILYGCGERSLLDKGGLAVVGSRKITDALKDYAKQVGKLAATAKMPIVSGAARGIDSAAMAGALENSGEAIGVMADSLGKAALAKSNRQALLDGRLVLVSAYDPSAGFNVGNAMQRNKAIYAFADAGLVVTSDLKKGGTWTGAIEQLERMHLAPVFICNGAESGPGNAALIQRGGISWPEPKNSQELIAAIAQAVEERAKEPQFEQLGLQVGKDTATYAERSAEDAEVPLEVPANEENLSHADRLMEAVSSIILDLLESPTKADDLAATLNVSKAQMNAWLKQMLEDQRIKKLSRPVRYGSVTDKTK
jgi:predicted Rossmann fold nucleotide-binding protein DprA/Smf involved in DNA uptake